jgi:thiamine transport system substrate-binding protein
MVVSYSTSPAAEVVGSATPLDTSPTASITAAGTCFRQVEFVGIITNTPNRDMAEKFVDFMLSVPFQQDMPLNMFVYPVNDQAVVPDSFANYAPAASDPASVPENLPAKRDSWIEAWTQTVLH